MLFKKVPFTTYSTAAQRSRREVPGRSQLVLHSRRLGPSCLVGRGRDRNRLGARGSTSPRGGRRGETCEEDRGGSEAVDRHSRGKGDVLDSDLFLVIRWKTKSYGG